MFILTIRYIYYSNDKQSYLVKTFENPNRMKIIAIVGPAFFGG